MPVLSQYAKAIVATLVALGGAIVATYPDSAAGKAAVIVLDALAALGLTYAVPNAPPPGDPEPLGEPG